LTPLGARKAVEPEGWLRFVHLLGLGTRLYILLLSAALPLCAVAAYQAFGSWNTSRAIAREFPIFEIANLRDAQFKVFIEGVSYAVDTGTLNTRAVDAVVQAHALTGQLQLLTDEPKGELASDLALIISAIGRSRSLESLTAMSPEIGRASKAIAAMDSFHHAQLESLLQGSVLASRRDTLVATLIAALSMSFALWFGRRLIQHILRVERTAHDALALNQAIMDAAPIGLLTFGPDTRIATANRACHFMHGYEPDELLGQPADVFVEIAEQPRPASVNTGGDHRAADGPVPSTATLPVATLTEVDRTHLRKDGSCFSAGVIELPLRDSNGLVLGGLQLVTDVTERKRAAARVEHLALHDSLTGLPNRLVLQQRAELAIARAQRHGGSFALALVDLDRFKHINDTLGHAVGDEVLKLVAQRLKDAMRSSDTLVRMGGDEFVLLLPDIRLPEDAREVGQKILQALVRDAEIEGHALHLSGSVGMAFFPEHGDDLKGLLRSADAAMYDAKSRGRDAFSLYESRMSLHAENQSEQRAELRQAVALGEFVLFYQPIVEARSGEVRAFEALMRWQHPERGLVMPGEFIALAEETGLIVPMGEWVIRQACADLARMRRGGHPELRMTVNVSPRQFMSDGLESCVRDALRAAGLQGSALELEITESVLMNSVSRTQEVLAALRAVGVRIAVDDFGTGYSSLSYLANFPVHTLKVDRSFVSQMNRSAPAASLTGAIISMGHSLGLEVIAEGVETADQQDHLVRLACDLLQGYRFGRPVPFDQLPALRTGTVVLDGKALPDTAGPQRTAAPVAAG
jgi:diguanylate cyclase (GGDEF)-like protein